MPGLRGRALGLEHVSCGLTQIGKEGRKPSLLTDDLLLYSEAPDGCTKKLLELMNSAQPWPVA